MRFTMLMPNPPPVVCGIVDHSLRLGEALEGLGLTVNYLAPRRKGLESSENTVHFWDGSAKDLEYKIRQLGTEVLWIQYSGYGYSSKGVPIGLARALDRVRRGRSAPTMVICMHETHANLARLGWRALPIQMLQRKIARRVARAGDVVFATVEVNFNRCIEEYGVSRESIALLPIASNIPSVKAQSSDRIALREQLNLSADARIAAIFGLWATQARTLELFSGELDKSLHNGEIDHVLAIGGEAPHPPDNILKSNGTRFNGSLTVLGPGSGEEIAKVLSCCDIGLIPTPPDYVRKSGVAAAFVAANLELWMKNDRSEMVVERNPAPFPEWEELASMAYEKIETNIENRGYTR